MELAAATTLAVAAGAWHLAGALDLRRAVLVVLAFWVLLWSHIAVLGLVCGALFDALEPEVLATAGMALAASEVVVVWWRHRAALRRSTGAVRRAAGMAMRRSWRHPGLIALTLVVLAIYAFQAAQAIALPETSWDGLAYRLVTPATWIQDGSITHTPQNLYADVFPKAHELLTAWLGTFLHSVRYAGLTSLAFVPLGATAVVALARYVGARPAYALLAGLGFAAMPALFVQASTAYVDISAGATVLAALAFLLAVPAEARLDGTTVRGVAGTMLLAGCAAGLSAGIKTTGLGIVAIVVIGGIVQYWRVNDSVPGGMANSRPRLWTCVVLLTAPIAALSAYWYLRTWLTYGSPFHPVAMLGFPGLGSVDELIVDGQKPAELRDVPLGIVGEILRSWAEDLRPHPIAYDQRLGGFGPQWLVLVVPALFAAAVAFARRRREALFGLVVPAVVLTLATPAPWWVRYSFPLAGVGLACFAWSLERLAVNRLRLLAPAGAAAFVAVTAVGVWWGTDPTYYEVRSAGGSQRLGAVELVTLLRDADDERLGAIEPWPAYESLDEIPDGETVVAVSGADDFTYPYVGEDLERRLVVIDAPQDTRHLLRQLERAKSRFVVLDDSERTVGIVDEMRATPARFRPVGPSGPNGGRLWEVGDFPLCEHSVLAIEQTRAEGATVVVDGLLSDECGAVAGVAVELWRGEQSIPLWAGSDEVVATVATDEAGRFRATFHDVTDAHRLFLRFPGGFAQRSHHAAGATAPFDLTDAASARDAVRQEAQAKPVP